MKARRQGGKRTHVSRDVRGHITTLGLDDGQRGQASTAELVAHLGSALEQPGVQVEDVTGVRLTTGGTTEQEGHLTVRDGLLGQIVVDDERWPYSFSIKWKDLGTGED
jgi:hypothetical protein